MTFSHLPAINTRTATVTPTAIPMAAQITTLKGIQTATPMAIQAATPTVILTATLMAIQTATPMAIQAATPMAENILIEPDVLPIRPLR